MKSEIIYNDIKKYLKENNIEEYSAEAKLIISHFTKLSIDNIILGKEIEEKTVSLIKNASEKRVETRHPIQYILGESNFMGRKFKVTKDTLIPRNETEILVFKTIEKIKNIKTDKKIKILDIGTGTGIIPINIALNADNVEILGVDISTSALSIAIENAQRYLPSNIVLFRKSDLFSNIKENFDIIVSNPPYIPEQNKNSIQKEVLFEPELALFAPDENGLYFYREIIKNAKNHLNKGGYILFELGINQSKEVKKIFEDENFSEIEIFEDLAKIDRVICAKY